MLEHPRATIVRLIEENDAALRMLLPDWHYARLLARHEADIWKPTDLPLFLDGLPPKRQIQVIAHLARLRPAPHPYEVGAISAAALNAFNKLKIEETTVLPRLDLALDILAGNVPLQIAYEKAGQKNLRWSVEVAARNSIRDVVGTTDAEQQKQVLGRLKNPFEHPLPIFEICHEIAKLAVDLEINMAPEPTAEVIDLGEQVQLLGLAAKAKEPPVPNKPAQVIRLQARQAKP